MGEIVTPSLNIVWSPLKGTSQELALTSPADETLYCGTRGCGKTEVQLMRYGKNVGRGYGEFYKGIIFDKEYKQLDDMVGRAKRLFRKIWREDQARWYKGKGDYRWVWATGEELLFRVMKDEDEYENYHGHEYPFIGWNELTKHHNNACYDSMMSCNRTSYIPELDAPDYARDKDGKPLYDEIPLDVFSTTNPYGVGHNWVKKRFIDGYNYGEMQYIARRIFSPRQQKEIDHVIRRVAVFGHYKENYRLPDNYIATLGNMDNPNKRAAWLEGRWDVAAGGAIEEQWDENVHILNNFTIPKSWEIFATHDWGSSAPFAVCWWGVSNGEDAYIKNNKGEWDCVSFPSGTLVLIYTWYGSDGNGKGINMSASSIAKGMRDLEKKFREHWFIHPTAEIEDGDADGQIFNKINNDDPTIAEWFASEGVIWNRADKSQGSRVNGLALFKERLKAATGRTGKPAFYVMRRNKDWLDLVPPLPSDEKNIEDVDTKAEDHIYDATRYAILREARKLVKNLSKMAGG